MLPQVLQRERRPHRLRRVPRPRVRLPHRQSISPAMRLRTRVIRNSGSSLDQPSARTLVSENQTLETLDTLERRYFPLVRRHVPGQDVGYE